jgi:hypothetical protein
MASALARYVQKSNMHPAAKSEIGKWMEQFRDGGGVIVAKAGAHALATVDVIREYGEAGLTGAALGALHARLPNGLDVPLSAQAAAGSTTTTPAAADIPIDFVGAVLLAGVAIAMPSQPASVDARHIGAACATVFSFRKTFGSQSTAITAAGGHVGGTFAGEQSAVDEDPLVKRARAISAGR